MSSKNPIQSLLQLPQAGIALESDNPQALIESFARLANTTGQAYYAWRVPHGLQRLGVVRSTLPNTNAAEGALHAIADRDHFGIYLFIGINDELQKYRISDFLQTILENSEKSKRKIILIDSTIRLPKHLQGSCACIRQQRNPRSKVRSNPSTQTLAS